MAIKLQNTQGLSLNGVKLLVYGQAGAGKTTLIKTLPRPIILSAEGGLLSLQGCDLPFIEIGDMDTLNEAFEWVVSSKEAREFKSIALDSISEIAEVLLGDEKAAAKDSRAAYGNMQDRMTRLIRAFRDIPARNVYFSAKVEKQTNETGEVFYSPSMPGQKLGQMLPYFFDEVLALRVMQDKDGTLQRALMCAPNGLWQAKDRSGRLEPWEAPDLGAVIKKIAGNVIETTGKEGEKHGRSKTGAVAAKPDAAANTATVTDAAADNAGVS